MKNQKGVWHQRITSFHNSSFLLVFLLVFDSISMQFHDKLSELVGRDHQILNLYNNIEGCKSDKSLWLEIDNSTVKSIEPAFGRIHSLTLSEGKDRKIGCLSNGLANCCSSFCCCCFREEGKEKGDGEL